jgi:hypothetical protein
MPVASIRRRDQAISIEGNSRLCLTFASRPDTHNPGLALAAIKFRTTERLLKGY